MLALENLTPRGLRGIDLEIADGDCLVVRGASGAGKTVMLRAIADLDENGGDAATGNLRRSLSSAPQWRRDVAYVPAESGWWADTVGAHMSETGEDCAALVAALELPDSCLAWDVTRLSTGERQRLALVRTLLTRPSVLLLDEPTSALDAAATEAVEQVIKRRMEDGMTVVLVSHDSAQAERLGSRTGEVKDGALVLAASANVS